MAAVQQTEYNQRLKFELEGVVRTYASALETFRDHVLAFVELVGIEPPVTEDQWNHICNYAKSVIAAEEIPVFLKQADDIDQVFSEPMMYLEHKTEFSAHEYGHFS